MPIDPIALDAIKAVERAATPGPWYRAKNHSRARVDDPDNAIGAFDGPYTRYIALVGDGGSHGDTDAQSNADAEFIAVARMAVPALLAEVDRLRAVADNCYRAGYRTGTDHGKAAGRMEAAR